MAQEKMSQGILRYLSIWGTDAAYLISLPADLIVYGPYLGSVQFFAVQLSLFFRNKTELKRG